MKWVTRAHIHVNRTATAWLIRRFLDPTGSLAFVAPDEVANFEIAERATGFDAPGARYPHRDEKGRCSFEQLVDEHFPGDAALKALGKIVHGADFPAEMDITRESPGLWAISQGFGDAASSDDEILDRASFLYDSLYAHLKHRILNEPGATE
jgi:hypothetical protein